MQTIEAQPLFPNDDPTCAVQYIGFRLDREAISALADPQKTAQLGIDYFDTLQCVDLTPETRNELARDFQPGYKKRDFAGEFILAGFQSGIEKSERKVRTHVGLGWQKSS